jgi:hypothetical protein
VRLGGIAGFGIGVGIPVRLSSAQLGKFKEPGFAGFVFHFPLEGEPGAYKIPPNIPLFLDIIACDAYMIIALCLKMFRARGG